MSVKAVLVDDLDGSMEEVETIRFGLDGRAFEIDLNPEHADEFREVIERYAQVARPSEFGAKIKRHTGGGSQRVRREPRVSKYEVQQPEPEPQQEEPEVMPDLRTWARENGYHVGDRGRVSGLIREAYRAAMEESGNDAA